jgi:Tfp pilus assembly protein FimT
MPSYQQFAGALAPRQQGTTLIEALSVLSIVAVMTSMAAPAVHDLHQRWRHSSTETSLQAFLRQSRAAAVSSLQDVVVCGISVNYRCKPGGDWSRGMMSFIDRNENRLRDADDLVLRAFEPRGGSIRSAKDSLSYNSLGGGDMGRLDVCTNLSNGYTSSTVFISLSGRARATTIRSTSGRCPAS